MNCQWCLKKEATEQIGDDDFQVCNECKPKVEKYHRCVICNKELSGSLGSYRRKQFQTGTCLSDECKKAYDVATGRLCCVKAEYINCVCLLSYTCPIHGDTHIGTHD